MIDIMASLFLFPDRYATLVSNPEGLLWYMLGEMGKQELVRRFAPMMFVATVEGDISRWSRPGRQVPGAATSRVAVKYGAEFALANQTCWLR